MRREFSNALQINNDGVYWRYDTEGLMKIDILIDKLTPCLIEIATGKVLQTTFCVANESDIKRLQDKGWFFDWNDAALHKANIYKLLVKGDDTIQGLIAAEVMRGAVFVHIAESAPHNQMPNKQYEGVGGHLFAIAMKLSDANGFGGYIYFDVKNMDLVNYYAKTLGASRLLTRIHEYRMEVIEEKAQLIIEKYTLEGALNVE
jgi:hypothetical protein